MATKCEPHPPEGRDRTQFRPIKSHSLSRYPLPLPRSPLYLDCSHPQPLGAQTPTRPCHLEAAQPAQDLCPLRGEGSLKTAISTPTAPHRTLHLAKAWPGGHRCSIRSTQSVRASLCEAH